MVSGVADEKDREGSHLVASIRLKVVAGEVVSGWEVEQRIGYRAGCGKRGRVRRGARV